MQKIGMGNPRVVIGLGFGDEGKGMVTDHLCSLDANPLVVRFSGGQQAGHTVVHGDARHVFSNFGSGTLRGAPTYWSELCTFDPIGATNELAVLKEKMSEDGVVLYINEGSMVTTPYDLNSNRNSGSNIKHGTCGIGVGATIDRHEKHYRITVGDLYHPSVLKIKLDLLKEYYQTEVDLSVFLERVEWIKETRHVFRKVTGMPTAGIDRIIYEGSQGLLLDQHHGFFPHVTRSSVGMTNVHKIGGNSFYERYYVTRAYQTRHGNGPMTNEDKPVQLKNNDKETNVYNEYQGGFRTSVLDTDLLKYVWEKDGLCTENNLVITCIDQLDRFAYTSEGVEFEVKNGEALAHTLAFKLMPNGTYLSIDPRCNLIKL